MRHEYLLHGLAISSEVALAERTVASTSLCRPPDLVVTVGEPRPTENLTSDRILRRALGDRVVYEAASRAGTWLVQVPGVASLEISHSDLRMHPDPAMPDAALLPLILAGTGLSFFLTINGGFCLHASAVEVAGRCIAFAGASGRGKTTLAGLACAAGHPLFADDVLRVDCGDGEIGAHRGSSEIRLRPDAVGLAAAIPGERRVTVDQRTAVRPAPSRHEILPLAAIVLPRPHRATRTVDVRTLAPPDAFVGLAECPRLVGWTHADTLRNEFDHLVRLSNQVPVLEANVPWSGEGEELDPRVADAVIHHALLLSQPHA